MVPLNMKYATVVPTTVTRKVYDRLKRRIMQGQLPPGTRLILAKIAGEMGVSLAPIRESLRLLESEGLIRHSPHRGGVVTQLRIQDFEEMVAVRRAVEGLAVRLACSHTNQSQLAKIRATVESLEKAIAVQNWPAFVQADIRFHQAIARASGNSVLEDVIGGLTSRMQSFLSLTVGQVSREYPGLLEHTAICTAIKDGDADLSERLMLEHLDNSFARATQRKRF